MFFWDPHGHLTDNTLSRDVFPAFWRPIMVTSISVALSIPVSQGLSTKGSATLGSAGDKTWTGSRVVRSEVFGFGKSLPESSEQPVVHLAKETSHCAERSWTCAVV